MSWIAASSPWFASRESAQRGLPREQLDRALMPLWQAGLIEASDWVKGQGQGLALTEQGREAAANPTLLTRILTGDPRPLSAERTPVLTTFDRGERARQAYYYPQRALITRLLIVANLIVFFAGIVVATRSGTGRINYLTGQDVATLYKLGAVTGESLLRGEGWRLLSCCFVHIGVLHLLLNLYLLYSIGTLAENLWGRWRFILIYLCAGLAGACMAMAVKPNTLLAGASGGIWGVMASLGVWMYRYRQHFSPGLVRDFARRLGFAVLLNTVVSLLPGISWAGHLGGAIGGITMAYALDLVQPGAIRRGLLGLLCALVVPAAAIGSLILAVSRSETWSPFVERESRQQQLRYLRALQPELGTASLFHAQHLLAETSKVRTPKDVLKFVKLEEQAAALQEAGNALRRKAQDAAAGPFAAAMPGRVQGYCDALTEFTRLMIEFYRGTNDDTNAIGNALALLETRWKELQRGE